MNQNLKASNKKTVDILTISPEFDQTNQNNRHNTYASSSLNTNEFKVENDCYRNKKCSIIVENKPVTENLIKIFVDNSKLDCDLDNNGDGAECKSEKKDENLNETLPIQQTLQRYNDCAKFKSKTRIFNYMSNGAMPHFPGPNETKLIEILNKSDYCLELSNAQRKYSSSSDNTLAELQRPSSNSEIFVGRIPKEVFEDELIPIFESIAKIYDLRLMIDPLSGRSRGYAFITYFTKKDAIEAVEKLDNFEIRQNKPLKIKISVPNVRLFIGNIPKEMVKADIFNEFQKQTPGLVDVIVYHVPNNRKRNRGFCFLEYETHKQASQAKRKLIALHMKLWGAQILVDWAEPLEEPDAETMSKVKVLYIRNLQTSITEMAIKSIFEPFGTIERVKKIKDYAFVHFERRESALAAMNSLQGKEIVSGEFAIEISLAKPPSDKKRKEEVLRNRERRLMNMMQSKSMLFYAHFSTPFNGTQISAPIAQHTNVIPYAVQTLSSPLPGPTPFGIDLSQYSGNLFVFTGA